LADCDRSGNALDTVATAGWSAEKRTAEIREICVTQATVGTLLASLSGDWRERRRDRDPRRDDRGGAAVGLIEFADTDGARWRVWHVETPPARAHLMDPQFRNGWLVFEREDGTDRRRLNRVPDDWSSLSPDRLAQLCRVAVPAVASRNAPSGPQPAWARPEPDSR
jgi:hypothetical protein